MSFGTRLIRTFERGIETGEIILYFWDNADIMWDSLTCLCGIHGVDPSCLNLESFKSLGQNMFSTTACPVFSRAVSVRFLLVLLMKAYSA